MTYETLVEFNRTGIDGLLLYGNHIWAGFIPTVLFCIFILIATGVYFSMQRTTGRGSFSTSSAVASWLTFVICIVLSQIEGLVNTFIMVACLVVSVLSTLWLMVDM